ncbi:YihY/virulence factor BrkB family protein, partial [Pseudoalteromonas sp. NEC-BIFX-2020_015]|uniref:YhjD/YihY/BrkB family envelope integrity protein n=1 Tax=Pseudoalteromonas sp. NEC-BIFX-2020_015 TaxID=2729544 RepID=UPI00146140D8
AGAPIGAGAAHVASASTADVAASRPRRYPPGVAGLVARAKALFTWWQETRPARALARFGSVGGGVLTGGIAYSALFSVFAAVTLGYTAFMTVLGGNEALRAEVLATADSYLPGLIGGEGKRGLIDPRDLVVGSGLSLAGIAAVVVLVYSATVAMAALRTAVRAVSGVGAVGTNLLLGKARELAGMVGVGLAVLLSTIVTLAVTAASDWLLRLLGLEAVRGAVSWAVGAGVALAVDAGMFVLVVVVLAGVHPGRREPPEG